ncbi:ABC transporter ATP-binding protein, partial [Rhodococcus sp. CX]|nr:ABC transporter ATP-binding protein [Rhodococcus sp. CX]
MSSHSAAAARAINLKKIYGTGETAVHALAGVTADFAAG